MKESCDANTADWKLENTTSKQLTEQETWKNGGEEVSRKHCRRNGGSMRRTSRSGKVCLKSEEMADVEVLEPQYNAEMQVLEAVRLEERR